MLLSSKQELIKSISNRIQYYCNSNNIKIILVRDASKLTDKNRFAEFELIKDILNEVNIKTIISDDVFNSDGLIIGLECLNSFLIKDYKKHIHSSDYYPLAGLYLSEILLMVNFKKNITYRLNDFEISLEEVEWANRENEKNTIITSIYPPDKFKTWYKYTIRQKEVLSFLYQRIIKTSHKEICAPVINREFLIGKGLVQ